MIRQWLLSWVPGTAAFRTRRQLDADLALLAGLLPQPPSDEQVSAGLARIFGETAKSPSPVRVPEQPVGDHRPVGFDEMVREWVGSLLTTAYLPMTRDQVHDRVTLMAEGLRRQTFGEVPPGLSAERIGRDLAQDLRLSSEAFRSALELIIPWLERVQRLTGEGSAQSRAHAVAALVEGFTEGTLDRVLDEQTSVTRAWLAARQHKVDVRVEDPHLFHLAFASARVPMAVLDPAGDVVDANTTLLALLGRPRRAVVGRPLLDHLADDTGRTALSTALAAALAGPGRPQGSQFVLVGAGGGLAAWATAALAWHPVPERPEGVVLLALEDTTERHAWCQRVRPGGDRDRGTNLPGRRYFLHQLVSALGTEPGPAATAVCVLRLDGVTAVVRALGPAVADRVVATVTARVTAALSDQTHTVLARLDRDRIAVLLADPRGWTAIPGVVRRLVDWASTPTIVGSHQVTLTPTVGVTPAHPGVSPKDLLRDAESALDVQNHGNADRAVIRPARVGDPMQRGDLLTAVPQALHQGQIRVAYRPIARFDGGTVVGAEATAIWHHPERGDIQADDLLVEAESLGLTRHWGPWLLRRAAAQGARWVRALGDKAPWITVKVPPRFAVEEDLSDHVIAVLEDHSLPAERLLLSMPEAAMVNRHGMPTHHLLKLTGKGLPVALAGLGTDIARYSNLLQLSFDAVVVSSAVTAVLGSAERRCERTLAEALITLGLNATDTLMLQGIDTIEQFREAKRLEAHLGLGRHIGGPLPPAGIDQLISAGGISV
ncbi:MAG: EAL domain-containing protein [Saccharothrix sp.]|nr:EAL domain-containing protein [Saccharothrix sp.]